MPVRSADPRIAKPNDNELDLPHPWVQPRSNYVITAETTSFLTSANRTFRMRGAFCRTHIATESVALCRVSNDRASSQLIQHRGDHPDVSAWPE
jgi:hypothetical protein